MSQNPDLTRSPDYFAARASEERELASTATDPRSRQIHLELAERYEKLVNLAGTNLSAIAYGRTSSRRQVAD